MDKLRDLVKLALLVEMCAEKEVDRLLDELDRVARSAGSYEYGLPLYDEYKHTLRDAVRKWLGVIR